MTLKLKNKSSISINEIEGTIFENVFFEGAILFKKVSIEFFEEAIF